MKNVRTLVLLCLIAAAPVFNRTASAFEMPTLGVPLVVTGIEIANDISSSSADRFPRTLPVFRHSAKPVVFPAPTVQALLDQSAFQGTNYVEFEQRQTNAVPGSAIRMTTPDRRDFFYSDPSKGGIVVFNHGTGVDPRRDNPPHDAVPKFEAIRDRIIEYAKSFGISTNEMEATDDGSIRLRKTDDETVARGGAIKFISRRSVAVSRSLAGFPLLGSEDKIELALGVSGRLLKFELRWPRAEAVRTNRLFTIPKIVDSIKGGQALADAMNQYPSDGVSKIILKDFRIFYYVPTGSDPRVVSTNVDIVPIASIHAVFVSKSGKTEDGALYCPVLEP